MIRFYLVVILILFVNSARPDNTTTPVSNAEIFVGMGQYPSLNGGDGLSVEYNKKSLYAALDYARFERGQGFIRVGKIFKAEPAYAKLGVCITEKNDIVNSYLMFNTGLGLNISIISIEWSHCSNAGISRPNVGYDLISFKMMVW